MFDIPIMQFPLKVSTLVGCWPPTSWLSLWKRTVYNTHSIFILLLLSTFLLPQCLDIILVVDNADDFTDTVYVMMAMVLAFCKMLGLLLNRKNIKMLIDTLVERPFRPFGPDEIKIRQKFDNIIQINAICYAIMVEGTCGLMTLSSLLTDLWKGDLAYREWLPYNHSTGILYYFTYFHQLTSLTAASLVNIACDSIICGFMLHICCQLEILECRLKRSLRERRDLGACVSQHDRIYKFAYMVNETFKYIIAIQFIVSTLVVCSSIYRVARSTVNPAYIPLLLYTIAMCVQILLYSWFGNEVKLKSVEFADRIFGMEWVSLDKRVKDSLILIMHRCLVPIEFSSAYVFTVNLDSFVKILKTSYTIYSVLKSM